MRILIVDDDARLRSFLDRGLGESGFECEQAGSAAEARERLESSPAIDLLLLDITMPGEDGLDLLADLRARAIGVPTLFLTARQEVEDRVRGLELGADDYLVKPFAFEELLARIRAIVRRRESAPVIERGPLRVDPARHVVHHGTMRVELSPREFGLLVALLDARGAVVRREALLHEVWGIEFDPGTNTVDVTVGRLRKRLHATGPTRIETVVGEGYRLVLPEDELEA